MKILFICILLITSCSECSGSPIQGLTGKSSSHYTVPGAAKEAIKQQGNLIRTDTGEVYTSTSGNNALELFFKDRPDPAGIKELWIKNLCDVNSQALDDHFKDYSKPTIYAGNLRNCEGLDKLIAAGFNVLAWEEFESVKRKRCERTSSINICQEA